MRLRLIAVGSRMPKWVEEGWHEYAKRLPSELALELVERSEEHTSELQSLS